MYTAKTCTIGSVARKSSGLAIPPKKTAAGPRPVSCTERMYGLPVSFRKRAALRPRMIGGYVSRSTSWEESRTVSLNSACAT